MDALKITVEVELGEPDPPRRASHTPTYRPIETVAGWAVFALDRDDLDEYGVQSALNDACGHLEKEADPRSHGEDLLRLGARWEIIKFGNRETYLIGAVTDWTSDPVGELGAETARLDPGAEADLRSARDWLDVHRINSR